MPVLSQGNIFEAASRVQLAIVFGHVGLNEMKQYWVSFATRHSPLAHVRDPFVELAGHPVEWSPGKWVWFVHDGQNHGMTDEQLADALDTAISWAVANGIGTIATNGIANTDHGHDTALNRASDDARVRFLQSYATHAEQQHAIAIELISMDDAFVRAH